MKQFSLFFVTCIAITSMSCKSNETSISNIDVHAKMPTVKNDTFILTEKSTNTDYAFTKNMPVNLGFSRSISRNKVSRYLDALSGPNQETISYTFIESCCPFISKTGETGTGLLDKYEITWDGNNKPMYIYINIYEKGQLLIPVGLSAKK